MVRFSFVRLVTEGDSIPRVRIVSNPCLVGGRILGGGWLVSVQVLAQARLAKPLSSLRGWACHQK